MDLSAFDVASASEKGADLVIKDWRTGQPSDVVFRIIGRDSPSVAAKMRELDKRESAGEKIDQERRGVELLAAVTVGWSGLTVDGEPYEYSHERALELYANPASATIAEQVGPFALSRVNFARN